MNLSLTAGVVATNSNATAVVFSPQPYNNSNNTTTTLQYQVQSLFIEAQLTNYIIDVELCNGYYDRGKIVVNLAC